MSQISHSQLPNADGISEDLQTFIEAPDSQPIQASSNGINQLTTQNHTEMLRLIQQYLHDHGFSSVAQDLEAKSGVHMEDRTMLDFRECIAKGLYNEAREILKARVASPILEIEYLLYEQEYLELVEKGENLKAVLLMQRELTPRCPHSHRLVELSKLNLCRTPEALHKEAKWAGSGAQGRQELVSKLQSIMPVTEMLPPRRLEHLVNQSILYQTSAANCTFHNPALMGSFSLLEDHNCSKRVSMPTKCIGVLKKHADEVWLIKFAPSGQRFASIGKDNIILLWSLRRQESHKGSHSNKHPVKVKYSVKCTHEIIGHSKQINSINWSPNEKYLISASHDSTAKVWDTTTGRCLVEINRHVQHVTAAAFLSDTRVLTSGTDKLLILWELKSAGENLEAIELARVETKTFLDIVVSPTRFVTLGQNQFQVHDSHSLESSFEHEVNETITSLALSKDGRQLLANVSLKQPRLELYELGDQKATLLRRFKGGHEQQIYVLRCAFGGGPHEGFVLCGSEDGSISIWNREKGGDVVAKLNGHAQVVNSVAWSPTDPLLFASTSDDMTIRLWGIESASACEVIEGSTDLKRVDLRKSQQNGKASPMILGAAAAEDEDIDEDEEEASDDEYDEEGDEDEEMIEEEFRQAHARERVLQSTRVLRSRREDDPEDSRMVDEEDEDDSEWEEGSRQ